jgi:thioredoxin reductase (NADPH)
MGGKLSNDNFKYDNYLNKGLSYCVVCDANFYKDKIVALIGDNKSIEDVDYLSNIAEKVYFINKQNQCSNKINVENFINVKDYKLIGKEKIEKLEVNNNVYDIAGAFYVSDTNSFNGFINDLDSENGYIKVDNNMHTSIDGIFACGDIINKNIKQVISACGDGALAALEAVKYVNKRK